MSDSIPNPSPDPGPPDGWELLCNGVLRSEFGRRPSRAVSRAMSQLTAEEALADTVGKKRPGGLWPWLQDWLGGAWSRPALAFGLVLIVTAAVGWWWRSHSSSRIPLAAGAGPLVVVSDAADARWAPGSARPKVGDSLLAGPLRLQSGVVELTFASSAKVAVEGPAQFTLTGGNSMELQSGKISTDVPKKARGFAVLTPTARVVDLGTRFGAMVGDDQSSEVDVFQGHVRLTTTNAAGQSGSWHLSPGMAMLVDVHGVTPATALPEDAFPRPNVEFEVRPQNCGFDVSARAALGEIPLDFGYWSGPAYALTGPMQGITPANGPGMLRFMDPAGESRDSEVWQLVDLSAYKKFLAGGNVRADLSAFFNRVRGGKAMSTQFGLTLAAFHGDPADMRTLWPQRQTAALALADKVLTDDDPTTWKELEVSAKLPPDTDFVVVEIRAIAPPGSAGQAPVFQGNFADLTDLVLSTPMRASSIVTNR